MDNPHPFAAVYEWECSDDTFKVTPKSGTVPPTSSQEVKVRWNPSEDQIPGQYEAQMALVLKGGSEPHKEIHLRAELPEASLQFEGTGLDVGPVPCNVPLSKTVVLKNTGSHDCAFRVGGEPHKYLKQFCIRFYQRLLPAIADQPLYFALRCSI